MQRKQKLELTWIGKENRPRLEPRILLGDAAKSYHSARRVSENDLFDNRLIFGDNLLALKALEQEFAGKLKCVFIDPPYNTGSAFAHYDDGVEHSLWLSLMRDRLEIIRRLLAEDGSIWITLDDNEHAYCKVLGDEIFGRDNFVASLCWQKKVSPANDAKWFSGDHDHLLVFAKNKSIWRPNRLPHSEQQKKYYTNPDGDPRGDWNSAAYTCAKSVDERPNLYYPITNPNTGEEIWPKKTRVWAYDRDTHKRNEAEGLIYWGKDGKGSTPRIKKFLGGRNVVPRSVWGYDEAGHTQEATMESLALFPGAPFSTPKPERLLHRVLACATNPGDWVLDSFAGSGTTGAVAHKMGRRWIMVEVVEKSCESYILPRLKKVIDGEDLGGVTGTTGWKGGGGFRYARLAPSLLERDRFGNWVISKEYDRHMLAEAVCKLEGFNYEPSDWTYWQHGHSTEQDFIYVTTQSLTRDLLEQLSDEVGDGRTLLVVCKAFTGKGTFPNLTVKKIPKAVMSKCEWGRDDYSLAISAMPPPPPAEESFEPMPVLRGARKAKATEPNLFGSQTAETKGGRK